MKGIQLNRKNVLVTGANGYIGNAVAKAFSRAGWKTYGLIRNEKDSFDLAKNEIYPIVGSPENLSFLTQANDTIFDVVVSNTEDFINMERHLKKVQTMFDAIAKRSNSAGRRPLMMFTSGCKDYGKMSQVHGDDNLAPHTEASPADGIDGLKPRTEFAHAQLNANNALYDATVLRPTIVYGHSSSHYGELFRLAQSSNRVLKILADPNSIMHSLHVDDCAEAYVALAEHPNRGDISQQAFNLSNKMYETAQVVCGAMAKSYGLELEFEAPTDRVSMLSVHGLANFSQWVGSDKVRQLTGWSEKKLPFADGISEYRLAYEAIRGTRSLPTLRNVGLYLANLASGKRF